MDEIINTLANYGAMGVCLLYFMYTTNKTLDENGVYFG